MPYSGYFHGEMAHLSVWNKALTPQQVNELAHTPLCLMNRTELSSLGLVAALCFGHDDIFVERYNYTQIKELSQAKIKSVELPGMANLSVWTIHNHRNFPGGFRDAVFTILVMSVCDRTAE
jgi:hypothetical protein